jgi:preprotein translocase subunit SecG
MQNILGISIIITSVLLVTSILLQQKGTGLSGVFGGGGASYLTRRGAERFLTFLTIFLAAVFVTLALLMLILK